MNAELPLGLPPAEDEGAHEAALAHLLRAGGPRSADDIEQTADAAIAAYDGDAKALVKALLAAYAVAIGEAERLSQLISRGYTRGGVNHSYRHGLSDAR
jgi:hypothetical protein